MEDNHDQTSHTLPSCQHDFPNSATLSDICMQSKTDITLGLPNKIKLVRCPQCNFYLHLPKIWVKLSSQSTFLLSFCFNKFKTNFHCNNVKLLRAEIVPSESNSQSIKTRVYVHKKVINGEILQQSYLVEFLHDNRICEPCSRVQANPSQSVYAVQLRKHRSHARSFLYLEHIILKHGVAANAVRINKMKHGTDFDFADEVCAKKLVDFIKGLNPVKICESKRLVSHDRKSSYYCLEYTFFIQVCSICSEDLIFLPPYVACHLGNIGPIVICTEVTNIVTLFDPLTAKHCFLDDNIYWRQPFKSLLTSKDLVEYVVLNIHKVFIEVTVNGKKFGLAIAEVARVKDLGKNERRFNIKTHLGHLLKNGDHALGYDLCGAKCSDSDIGLKEHIGGGVILIKKRSEEKVCQKRRAERQSHLKDLEKITNEVLGMSLGSEEPTLEEKLGDLDLSGEEYKEKKKARRTA
ncbi:uncharacterized protein LOC127121674 [Lathyrus oleraceus]|uniref:uncharacterized protein LOC127121674 n=1 Tax=Pisum sativum TaxID=3888 RepID=UPI0021D2E46A|nr:uncharacterized protein LOC127121674 [Pisum sativum]